MIVVFELNVLPILKKRKKRKEKYSFFAKREWRQRKTQLNAICMYVHGCQTQFLYYSTMASWWKVHTLNSTAYAYVSQYEIRDIYMWNSFLSLAFWLRNAEWVLYQMVRLSRSEL